ncbi:MAG: glycoside hydrolase family 127 protein [Christiangramia sp.]|uniref:glycoside hydrolase family 127 protein n=1 Tax=Christiangramia sp. TaxID=1931228 RepID=UPI003241D89B
MMKKKMVSLAGLVISVFLLFSCKEERKEIKENDTDVLAYHLEPVDIRHVKLTDSFWLPIIERVQEKTIDYALNKVEEEGRLDNFLIAGGQMEGDVKGAMPFDDTDVYKIIEGASYSLISAPNDTLSTALDSLISIIQTGQEKDGYLTTWRTIDPAKPPASWVKVNEGKRWEYLAMSHELYNAGHLYEAAAAHYRATGKENFLNIALKNADLMVKTFGDQEGQIHAVPGHQIIETGLIKLYSITENKDYLKLARYFLDNRGNPDHHELFGEYSQDHEPVTQQDEVVGHAVRAVYMYAGMTDIATLQQDSAYYKAVTSLWENMVNKKMYITGGIGAKHEGEAFGENYELPNLTAYNETCAAIGDVYWNHRLHNITGEVKYFDVIERTLYNGLISGLSLDGQKFFYPNALESDGTYEFNQGACTRKDWFDCSCCPTNVIRFIPSIPGLIYSKSESAIYVDLYASNTADIEFQDQVIQVSQKTAYPWNGMVEIAVEPQKPAEFELKLRVPGWARNEVLPGNLYQYSSKMEEMPEVMVNGKKMTAEIVDGYLVMDRKWEESTTIVLDFPMQVREVLANDKVEDDRGKVSLEYGPIVYAVEEVDNKDNFEQLQITPQTNFSVQFEKDLLQGVNTLKFDDFKAIPYYSWSNRGIGKMKVWLKNNTKNRT